MERSRKIAFGVASVVPIIGSTFIMIFFFSYFPQLIEDQIRAGRSENPFAIFRTMQNIMIPALLLGVINLGIIALFVVNVFRNPNVPKNRQALWAILVGLLGTYMMPVYWYMFIWKDPVVDIDDVE